MTLYTWSSSCQKQHKEEAAELTIHSGMWKAEVPSLPSHFSIVRAWLRDVLKQDGELVCKGQGYLRMPKTTAGQGLKEALISSCSNQEQETTACVLLANLKTLPVTQNQSTCKALRCSSYRALAPISPGPFLQQQAGGSALL